MKPSVGRIVHYRSHGTPGGEYKAECRAAIVTEVGDPDGADADFNRVGLAVLNPTGIFLHSLVAGGCKYDPGTENDHNPVAYSGGTWHWPERV